MVTLVSQGAMPGEGIWRLMDPWRPHGPVAVAGAVGPGSFQLIVCKSRRRSLSK